jgi:hypothetical protein
MYDIQYTCHNTAKQDKLLADLVVKGAAVTLQLETKLIT